LARPRILGKLYVGGTAANVNINQNICCLFLCYTHRMCTIIKMLVAIKVVSDVSKAQIPAHVDLLAASH
jgi:hypothetical protein